MTRGHSDYSLNDSVRALKGFLRTKPRLCNQGLTEEFAKGADTLSQEKCQGSRVGKLIFSFILHISDLKTTNLIENTKTCGNAYMAQISGDGRNLESM